MIEKQVTFEGILREEEEQSNETAKLQDYRIAAITKARPILLSRLCRMISLSRMPFTVSLRHSTVL